MDNKFIEYAKYVQDPCYFMEQNIQVFDQKRAGGYVPFKLFEFQKEIVHNYNNNIYNLIVKSRQAGASIVSAAYVVYKLVMSTKDKPERIAILGNKLTTAKKFLKEVKNMLIMVEESNPWVFGSENIDKKKEKERYVKGKGSTVRLEMVNGSEVVAVATSSSGLRSQSPTFIVVDEAAFIAPSIVQDGLLASINGAAATGSSILFCSTPNSFDPLYHPIMVNSLNGDNEYKISYASWVYDPRYNDDLEWILEDVHGMEIERFKECDQENAFQYERLKQMVMKSKYKPWSSWFQKQCANANYDKRVIAQEYLMDFRGSGSKVVEGNTIKYYETEMVREPILKTCFDRKGWVFKEPVEGHKYIAGADSATGDSTDNNALTIIDIDTLEIVFEYRGKCDSKLFADILFEWSTRYCALTVIDSTGGYSDLLIHLLEVKEFKYMYYEEYEQDVKVHDKNKEEEFKRKVKKAGFKIQKYRVAAINYYVGLLEQKLLIVPSMRHVNELSSFIWKNGRADHQVGYNDDCLMSTIMAVWCMEVTYGKMEKAVKRSEIVSKQWLGFGLTTDDLVYPNDKQLIYKSQIDPIGEHSWVFGKYRTKIKR